ncbi:hypothetical protein [Motilimonas pumila]|nr:hypothetical protein [Motilimonas pumila]
MKTAFNKMVLAMSFASFSSLALAAENVPYEFKPGTPAKADEVNANFNHNTALAKEALAIAKANTGSNGALAADKTVPLDCAANAYALKDQVNLSHGALNVNYLITGACHGPIAIRRDGVSITGDGSIVFDSASADSALTGLITAWSVNRLTVKGVTLETAGSELAGVAAHSSGVALENLTATSITARANSSIQLVAGTTLSSALIASSSALTNTVPLGHSIQSLTVLDTSSVVLEGVTITNLVEAYGNATVMLSESSVAALSSGGNAIISVYGGSISGPYNLWSRSMLDSRDTTIQNWSTTSDVGLAASYGGKNMTIDGEYRDGWGWGNDNIVNAQYQFDSLNNRVNTLEAAK